MPVKKRKGSKYWHVEFTTPDGTRIRESTKTTSKKQAQEYEVAAKARFWREQKLNQPQTSWQQAVVLWLDSRTHKDRRNILQRLRWLDPFLGNLLLTEINVKVIERIKLAKLDEGAKPATVNRHLAIISAVLRNAHKAGLVESVPSVSKLKEPEGRLRYLTTDEAQALLKYLGEDPKRTHLRDIVQFGLATGLREANIIGLQWSRVDMPRKAAWVPAEESKTGRAIQVPLNDMAMEVLERRQGIDDTWVFTYEGHRVTRCNNSSFRKALEVLEFDDVNFHTIRHTWASWHVMNGTPLEVLMKLGGWTNMRTVLRYAHLSPDYLASFSNNVTQFLPQSEDRPL